MLNQTHSLVGPNSINGYIIKKGLDCYTNSLHQYHGRCMENIHIDSGVNFASRTKLSSGIQGLRLFGSQGYHQ